MEQGALKLETGSLRDFQPTVPAPSRSGASSIQPMSALDAMRDDWRVLADRAVEPNPFYEPWFLLPALEILGPRIGTFTLRSGDRMLGLLPIVRRWSYADRPLPHMANWLHANAFCGSPLVAPGAERSFWVRLLEHADQVAAADLFLHLEALDGDGPLVAALARLCRDQGRCTMIVHREERALLSPMLDAEAYFRQAMSGKKRKELRRQQRRLEEEGEVRFVAHTDETRLPEWIESFLFLERSGWKGREGSALLCDRRTADLFAQALTRSAKQGRLHRLSLELDGRPIGMLASFAQPPNAFSFKTAYDEHYARFSPRGSASAREPRSVRTRRRHLGGQLRRGRSSDDRAHLAPAPPHGPHQRGDRRRPPTTGFRHASTRRTRRTPGENTAMTTAPMKATEAETAVFDEDAREAFAGAYPETPIVIRHRLASHALLELPALARLASALPPRSIEYNFGDLPIGVDGKPDANGLTIEETIRRIADAQSWAVLKNIGQAPEYEALLHELLGELRPAIEARTGALLRPQGFVFISSPRSVTPYHFDPEHNLLLQLTGTKEMMQFPAGDARCAADEIHEGYHSGGPRELAWDESLHAFGTGYALGPGQALHVPVMAPHYVRNGPEPSISLSITWRSEWSFAEADARGMNRLIRRAGWPPRAPGRWPATNAGKATAFRALRRLGVVD